MSVNTQGGLVVETVPLEQVPELLDLLAPSSPLLWWRRNEGMVGHEPLITREFRGNDRFREAAAAWKEIVSTAEVTDQVNLPGTGLMAFGTFGFRYTSAIPSVLIIPRLIVGRRGGASWLTRIHPASESASPLSPEKAQSLLEELISASGKTGSTPHVTLSEGAQTEADFLSSVSRAVERINTGEVDKVVLSRDLQGSISENSDLRFPLKRLAESYPDCWTFSVDGLLGSSPETLVSVHGNKIQARVLAGTARRGSDANSDLESAAALASSHKDLDEHGFATRSVLDALAPFTGTLTVSESPFTLKLPNVWHLATDIAGTLSSGSSSLDLVDALHPTAAVAGTPTAVAVTVIDDLEPFDRGRYAGPVGWVGANGDGEWAIALRCAQVSADTITAYAGCGIVSDSIPEKELVETEMKFRPIVDAFS